MEARSGTREEERVMYFSFKDKKIQQETQKELNHMSQSYTVNNSA